jgi:hypothetical protein
VTFEVKHTPQEYLPALRRLSAQMEAMLAGPHNPTAFALTASTMSVLLAAYLSTLPPDLGTAEVGSPSTGGGTGEGGPSCP